MEYTDEDLADVFEDEAIMDVTDVVVVVNAFV